MFKTWSKIIIKKDQISCFAPVVMLKLQISSQSEISGFSTGGNMFKNKPNKKPTCTASIHIRLIFILIQNKFTMQPKIQMH